MKRIISFLLALVMTMGMVPPLEARAEETGVPAETTAVETVTETTGETGAATEPAEETTGPTEAAAEPEETTPPAEGQTDPSEPEPAEEFVLGSASMAAQNIASEDGFSYSVYTTASGTEAACVTRYAGGDVDVTVPDTLGGYPVGRIGGDAFADNPELETVVLPEGVTEIADGSAASGIWGAFAYCYNLKRITLPGSLTKIGSFAFYSCKSLAEIDLPAQLTGIGDGAFAECSSLTKAEFPEGLKTVGSGAWKGTGITQLHLPDSVTGIDLTGLSQQLTAIRWTAGIPVIDNARFRDFVSLETVVLPEGVTEIADGSDAGGVTGAFAHCYNLKTITLPGSLTKIGHNAFYNCKTLAQITLPANLKTIGDRAFGECSALTALEFPDGLETVGNLALSGTGITSLHLPDSITAIDLTGLSLQLTDIRWTAGIPVLDNTRFRDFLALEAVVLPEGVTELADGDLSNGIQGVFANCFNLKSIVLPQSLTKIGSFAFYDCKTMPQITLPGNLKTIGDHAFSGCESIEELAFPYGLETIGSQALKGTEITALSLPDSVTGIDLTGLEQQLTDIRWTAGIPVIDNTRFQNFVTLETVVLPEGVTELADGAPHEGGISGVFAFCYNLKSLTLPGSLTKIGNFAFLECEMLSDVYYSGTKRQWEALTENMGLNNGPLVNNTTLHFAEIDTVTVAWVTGTDQTLDSTDLQTGDILSAPVGLELAGHTLCGWYTDAEFVTAWNFDDPVTEDMTLYARWLPNELDKNEEDTGICIEILNEDDVIYTGKAIKPEIIVRDGGKILTADTDYTVSYKNNTKACDENTPAVKDSKKPQIIVQGKGNYKSSKKIVKTFTIRQADMKDLQISLPAFVACKAKNKSQTVKAAVSTDLAKVAASNYVIRYYTDEALTAEVNGITAPGLYYITVAAKPDKNGNCSGNFTGVSDEFTIQAVAAEKLLSAAKITVPKTMTAVEEQPDENTAIKTLISKVVMNKVTYLTEDIDAFMDHFVITAVDTDGREVPQKELGSLLLSAGKKSITVRAAADNPAGYLGEKTVSVTVKGIALKKSQFLVTFGEENEKAVTKVTYNAKVQTPGLVSDLEEGKDYTVTYKQGKTLLSADQVKNAGNYTLVITGKGNYSGTLTYSFSISKVDLAKAYSAGQLAIEKSPAVLYTPLGAKVKPAVTFNGETLAEGTDFTVSFSGNKTVTDAAAVTLKGKGNFSGTLDKKKTDALFYSITPKNLRADGIVIQVNGLTVKKGEITGVKYTVTHDGKSVATKQYTGTLTDNGETVTLTITGKGLLYTGSRSIEISKNLIKTSDSKKVRITLPKENRYYTGSPIQPLVTITDAEGNDISGCFHITYGENTKVGSGSITITGIPEKGYYGAKTLKFTILPRWAKWIFG